MASTISSALKLVTAGGDPDHERILKACNEALKLNKQDVQAQHVKAIALLNLDRFDDAVRLLEDRSFGLQNKASLEYAYALYKTGRHEDARKAVRDVHARGGRHVEAQSSYRMEDFATAHDTYMELAADDGKGEESDIRINNGAVEAQLEWQRRGELVRKKKADGDDLSAFESAYNAACGCIARHELTQAEFLLAQAKRLCTSSDLGEDDKKAELLPISVQQVYTLNLLGKHEQASTVSKEITDNNVPDSATNRISKMNKILAESNSLNPYLAHRIYHHALVLPESDRFFNFQATRIKQNETALDFMTGKVAGLKTSQRKNSSLGPDPDPVASAAAAAATQFEVHGGREGVKALTPLLESQPKDVGVAVAAAHLCMSTKNHGSAILTMETLFRHLEESGSEKDLDMRFSPGLVAIVISLYAVEGSKSRIETELEKASTHWRGKQRHTDLLRAAGLALLKSDDERKVEQAHGIFQTCSEVAPMDPFAKIGLIAATAVRDPLQASKDAHSLTAINKLTAGIDVAALEEAGIPSTTQSSNLLSRKRAADTMKRPKKRIRKSRLPKDFDPKKKPDPERWLPLRDRSNYRSKGKKAKKVATTQGGFDEAEGRGSGAATPVVGVIGGGGAKSKKKKNKK